MSYTLTPTAEEKLARIQALAEVGVSKRSIARVINLDYDDEVMQYHAVCRILEGRMPRHWRMKEA